MAKLILYTVFNGLSETLRKWKWATNKLHLYEYVTEDFVLVVLNNGPGDTNLLCVAKKYLYALSDLLMTIELSLPIGPPTEPVHDPKLHFKDPP